MSDREWKPNVTVAAVIEREGRFLLVEEHTPEGLRFNQPAGHLEPGESLLEATVREALEETAHRFVPSTGPTSGRVRRSTYLRLPTVAASRRGAGRKLDDGIVRAVWMTIDEVRATADRHRSPLILQCIGGLVSPGSVTRCRWCGTTDPAER